MKNNQTTEEEIALEVNTSSQFWRGFWAGFFSGLITFGFFLWLNS